MNGPKRDDALTKIARAIVGELADSPNSLCGMGSGTTISALLPFLSLEMARRSRKKDKASTARFSAPRWVPTSLQILLAGQELGFELTWLDRPSLDLVVDGADQIDRDLNLIKGGGGALLREKILISSARKTVIVADERKSADLLCSNDVRVPVEADPFARVPVADGLRELGGSPELRLAARGFPFYTESGNIIFDTGFSPLREPAVLEREIKSMSGVIEVGIFTPSAVDVYLIGENGTVDTRRKR